MAVFLSPVGGVAAQFFTNNGVPLSGGKLYTYAAGTTTPAATYTSSSGVTAHANPIVLDSGGRVPGGETWLTDGTSYKFLLKDSNDVLIATYDNIVGINSNFVNFFAEEEIQTATAGQTVFTLANPYVPGGNTLSVFVDGVNQYSGSTYSYVETSASTVTFDSGLHVGALVKFTTVQSLTSGQQTDAALVTYNEGDTGAVTYTVRAKLQQIVSVKDFGAVGNGTTDDTAAINAAITAISNSGGGIVIIPNGTFAVTPSVVSGITAYSRQACIVGKDNVTLQIDGVVKLKTGVNIGSTLASIITGPDAGLTNFQITGSGTVDGNVSNVTASQTLGLYLPCVDSVTVTNIRVINTPYLGIQFVTALPYVAGYTFTNGSIIGTTVKNTGSIGIQASHSTHNLIIANNTIDTCGDNCIDVYNENSTITADAGVISITGNTCYAGLVGIFPETSADVNVTGNSVYACTYGVAVNRVNGAPRNLAIVGNTFGACATGASITGDTGGVFLSSNTFDKFTSVGLQLGGGANVSYVVATNNTFNPYATTTNVITITGSVASFNVVRQNYLLDASHNSANLILNTATTSTANTIEPLMNVNDVQPVLKTYAGGVSASSGTATITVPSLAAGKLVIKSSAGGARYSVWSGSFVSSATGVTVAQDSTGFIATANNIASVVGSAGTLVVTITFAASGAAGTWNAWAEYF
jgi:hypothetical protein